MEKCTACYGRQTLDLPISDFAEPFPCPCCIPWKHGFAGYGVKRNGEWFYFIEPSAPNELAKHNKQREKEWLTSI
jgi:hypothetical protein